MFIVNEGDLAAHSIVVKKLWGTEFVLVNNDSYCWKLLKVMPHFQSSIHCHLEKDETFVGIQGVVQLNIHKGSGEVHAVHCIHPGEVYRLRPRVFHSFQAINVAWVSEISTPHSDSDVQRIKESTAWEIR